MALPGRNSVSSSSSGASGFQFVNSPFGDTTYTKLFVGGLAWETQSQTMGRYFEQFGQIHEAVVITDKNTGRSKGYGFVSIPTPLFSFQVFRFMGLYSLSLSFSFQSRSLVDDVVVLY